MINIICDPPDAPVARTIDLDRHEWSIGICIAVTSDRSILARIKLPL
jgi:hypothetical protein